MTQWPLHSSPKGTPDLRTPSPSQMGTESWGGRAPFHTLGSASLAAAWMAASMSALVATSVLGMSRVTLYLGSPPCWAALGVVRLQ